jgi:hypothetical protein
MTALSVREELAERVVAFLDQDIEIFDAAIITPFKQQLTLVNERGKWTRRLVREHIGYATTPIEWGARFHSHFYLEWMLRTWLVDRMQVRLDLKPALGVIALLKRMKVPADAEPEAIEELLFTVLHEIAVGGAADDRFHLTTGARQLYSWALEQALPGFDEFRQIKFDDIRVRRHGRPDLVSLRNAEAGPFTRAELACIEGALILREELVTERAMFLPCRDWGLRPVQLALLRVHDVGKDELGPYMNIPSVKGIARSRRRRDASNMVKRSISDDTYDAVLAQIDFAEAMIEAGTVLIREMLPSQDQANFMPERPLFPSIRTKARLERMMSQPALREWALHIDACHISAKLKSLTWKLAIPNSRGSGDESALLQIGAMRLRRTKGTAMYLNGASLEQIAEALDHQGTGSVQHYAKYNMDLFLLVSDAQLGSKEIVGAAIAWDGEFTTLDEAPREGERPILALGKCRRKTLCPGHPTVTCYACPAFRPAKDADHVSALARITEERDMFAQTSSLTIIMQSNTAIAGAKNIIAAVLKLS